MADTYSHDVNNIVTAVLYTRNNEKIRRTVFFTGIDKMFQFFLIKIIRVFRKEDKPVSFCLQKGYEFRYGITSVIGKV